jgi:hypothetical protein
VERQPKPAAARPRRASAGGPGSRLRTPADAAADIDRVVDAYITEVILEENPSDEEGMYWWWPRAAWVDPNQLIVDADDGTLRRVQFTTNDRQEITFAEPVEVLEEFTDLAPSAKAQVLAAAHVDAKPRSAMRVFESRDDVPGLPNREPEAGVGDGSNNVGMTPEQIRESLGLEATATDEQVQARITELRALEGEGTGGEGGEGSGEPADGEGAEGGEGSGSEGGEGEGAPAGGEGAGGEGAAPPAAGADDGFVRVPASEWERVQQGAAAGTAVAAAAETTRRDDTIAAAAAAGKIAPAAKGSMENLHKRDPDAFYNLLTASVDKGGLAENLLPVSRQGGAGQEAATAAAALSPQKMAAMFPEVTFAEATV